jgi:hypothetical protein
MRVIIGPHNTLHIPRSPSSDVSLCGETGDPDENYRFEISCAVCTSIAMGQTAHSAPPAESVN